MITEADVLHEVGHCVCAWSCGWTLGSIDVDGEDGVGHCDVGFPLARVTLPSSFAADAKLTLQRLHEIVAVLAAGSYIEGRLIVAGDDMRQLAEWQIAYGYIATWHLSWYTLRARAEKSMKTWARSYSTRCAVDWLAPIVAHERMLAGSRLVATLATYAGPRVTAPVFPTVDM